MKELSRRKFISKGTAVLSGVTIFGSGIINMSCAAPNTYTVDKVKLGKTGLKVSRIAMGTGTIGGNKQSNQTRLGMETFVKMTHYAYERGITFFDTADTYGSLPFVGNAVKNLPREKITILSKIWTYDNGSKNTVPVDQTVDRLRKEANSDYLDILLMHCIMRGDWKDTRSFYMDGFSKAKQAGYVKAIGVSCHNKEALIEASTNPWVDVIMARINPFTSKMDGSPEEITKILEQAMKNGKGVIGMKIFGEGSHVADNERQQSIEFAVKGKRVHCMTLGMESEAQVGDAIDRTMKIVKG